MFLYRYSPYFWWRTASIKPQARSFQALAKNDERLFRLCLNENLGSAGGFSEGIKGGHVQYVRRPCVGVR